MNSTTQNNPPNIHVNENGFHVQAVGRNYGLALGVVTAIYLIAINFIYSATDLPLGLRFAKHLLIIPVVWMAIAAFAERLPEGRKFKQELGLLWRIAAWSAVTLALANILFFAVTFTSFEQFSQDENTLFSVLLNSGLLIFETSVFVMIIGFAILQAYKGKGSPED